MSEEATKRGQVKHSPRDTLHFRLKTDGVNIQLPVFLCGQFSALSQVVALSIRFLNEDVCYASEKANCTYEW